MLIDHGVRQENIPEYYCTSGGSRRRIGSRSERRGERHRMGTRLEGAWRCNKNTKHNQGGRLLWVGSSLRWGRETLLYCVPARWFARRCSVAGRSHQRDVELHCSAACERDGEHPA